MPTAKVTIMDAAAHAGVVPSTVSRVVNGYPDVSAKTHAPSDRYAQLQTEPRGAGFSHRTHADGLGYLSDGRDRLLQPALTLSVKTEVHIYGYIGR